MTYLAKSVGFQPGSSLEPIRQPSAELEKMMADLILDTVMQQDINRKKW